MAYVSVTVRLGVAVCPPLMRKSVMLGMKPVEDGWDTEANLVTEIASTHRGPPPPAGKVSSNPRSRWARSRSICRPL